jgi:hypothetical protein
MSRTRQQGLFPARAEYDLGPYRGHPVGRTWIPGHIEHARHFDPHDPATWPIGILVHGGPARGRQAIAIPGAFAGTCAIKLAAPCAMYAPLYLREFFASPSDVHLRLGPLNPPSAEGGLLMGLALEAGETGTLIEATLIPPRWIPFP